MYLVPIHVPIYRDGERQFVTSEWWRALELLRDSFEGRLGPVVVAAPTLPAAAALDQRLVEHSRPRDGIELCASFDLRCRAREYWLEHRPGWVRLLDELARRAAVVHAGLDDVYRPIAFEGFRAGIRRGRPTLFIQDTDIVVQQRQLAAGGGAARRLKARAYGAIYERLCRWSVARADLSLLKGSTLMAHYGTHARNAREFHDTSFSAADIVSSSRLEQRLATLSVARPLRLAYCGRLTARKGVDASLQILARALAQGGTFEFDVIGDGSERGGLERLVGALGLSAQVRFLGVQPYDSALLARLASYDALLFTPTAEDTPRMVFDAYAAGLPIIAFDIGYMRERAAQEHATVLLPLGEIERASIELVRLSREPQRLVSLARAARTAAEYHSAERWYRRRADWTLEAVERHKTALPGSAMERAA